jgi:PAS domain S-box-containing protein
MTHPNLDSSVQSTADRWRQLLPRLIVIAIAYVAAAKIGLLFVLQPEGLAGIWPASGVALAVLLLSNRRDRPAILALVFIVNTLSNLASGNSIVVSLAFAFANTLEPAIGAWAMTYAFGDKITFAKFDEVLGLLAVATLANAATAFVGAWVPAIAFGAPYWNAWLVWWIADGLGMMIVTPLVVSWLADDATTVLRELPSVRWIEAILMLIALAIITWHIFGINYFDFFVHLRPHMLFPILIWTALRFSPRGGTLALTVIAVISLGVTVTHLGSFPLGGDTDVEQLIGVQSFLSVASITTLMINAIFTERKRASQALIQSERRFRALVEHGVDAVTLLGADGAVVYDGPTVERLSGYTPGERLNKNALELVHPQDLPIVQAKLERVIQNPGTSTMAVFRSIRKDGTMWWAEATATNLLQQPEVQAVVVNFRDVTLRKRAEELLELERAQAQQYFDAAAIMNVALSNRGLIMEINRKACNLLEYSKDELFGRDWFDTCIPENQREMVHRVFDNLMAGQGDLVEIFENMVVTKSGKEKLVRWHNTFICDASNRIVGTLASGEDITERKRAEERLQQSERDLKQAQQVGKIGSWRWDIKSNHLEWSDEMYHIFDIDKKTFTGYLPDVITQAIHPDDRAKVEASNNSVSQKGKPIALEYRIVLPDQSIRVVWGEAGELIRDEQGQPAVLTGIVQDITERKHSEEQLYQSEERLLLATNAASIGVWDWDIVHNNLVWDESMYRLYGIHQGDFAGAYQAFLACVHPDDAERVDQDVQAAIRGEKEYAPEFRIVWPDHSIRFIQANSKTFLDQDGNPQRMIGTNIDITERKQAEEALRKSEAKFRAIVDNSNDGILFGDANAVITYRSPSYNQINGYPNEERVGHSGFETVHPDDMDGVRKWWAQVVQNPSTPFKTEYRIRHKDGTWRWVDTSAQNLLDNPDVHEIVVTSRDITERKQAEEKLKEQLDELHRWHQAMLGRETRIIKLKNEVNELLVQVGKPPRYPSAMETGHEI